MRGKLIVIEGTDCSGKETQSKLLIEALRQENIKVERFSFHVMIHQQEKSLVDHI